MTRPAPSPDTKPTAAPPRQLRRAIVLLLLAAAVQLALVSLPDTMGDVLVYRLWTRGLAGGGLAAAYWPAEQTLRKDPVLAAVDYPPLFPYLLWGIGHALGAISPALLEHHDGLLDALIRLPGIVASLLLAWLVYVETRRLHPAWAEAALAMVALNPALVFDTAYWGQTDALCAALMAAALVGLVRGRPGWAWVAAAAAALAKPFAYPMLPVLAVASQRWFGPWRTLRSAALGASVFAAGLLPFLWIGRLSDLVRTLFWQLDAMPFVSVNAHNLWWLIGRGTPWTPASARPLGISWGALAALAFLGFLALVLLRLARSEDRRSLYVAAATGAFGFFVLSTHMHENHLFYAVAWLGLAGLRSAPVRTLFLALTATLLANMALHDPFLTHTLRAYVPGPLLYLPPVLQPPRALFDGLVAVGYPWIADEVSGVRSALGVLATLVNAQANVLLLAWWTAIALRHRGLDPVLEEDRRPALSRLWASLAVAFVVVSAVPFLAHAVRDGGGDKWFQR